MNKSQLFKKAHSIAKATLNKFNSYRDSFSAGLKEVYMSLKNTVARTGDKAKVVICSYKGNFLVKVPYAIKDSFKKAVKARWQPETKEWFVTADQKDNLETWVNN